MNYLIGNSGLVGKNLLKNWQFDFTFNSSNIDLFKNIFVDGGDIVLACLPATKWQINQNKLKDFQNINQIINIISKSKFNKIILISTIDVYLDSPLFVDETYEPFLHNLHYGSHRLLFEKMIKDFIDYKYLYVFRLPALFGEYLKKNVLYDLINNNNTNKININTYYQWYYLNRLCDDIDLYVKKYSGGTFNFFTQPICTADIVDKFFNKVGYFGDCVKYDWKTKYHTSGYIQTSEQVMSDLENFINETRNKQSSLR